VPTDPIVVNEWIFHDMKGENGLNAQQRVEVFLEALRRGTDQIVVPQETRWTDKAWQLWEERDVRVQVLSKLLYLGILIDPLKCRRLNPDQLEPLPDDLAVQVPGDDVYLFKAALAGGAEIIVTTDQRLVDMVTNASQHGIQLRLRDDFYVDYLVH
jgi:hypothetical protein